jgi:hypothetical protein
MLGINVSGKQATRGFCLLKFPRTLVEDPYIVTVNNESPSLLRDLSDEQFAVLYFAYPHEGASENIVVVVEFPRVLDLLCLFILAQTALLILLRKRRKDPLSRLPYTHT